ncbi:cysteine desulfurase NifS [Candidatus Magnetomonas plexicatena]|uniref:cysteine desulfurase NifS n=1 Tax=Candidatus Magnetomonas plexicatena TaxID=2552947 RepID=UPI001C74FA4E|nr:cysteine desulfurase NifS [Nitrospirales bacterium LBB_01]
MELIYLDNNATTMVAPEVKEAMSPWLDLNYGNPSSAYSFGRNVLDAIDLSRSQVASLIGAKPDEIIFTSCGTEADNTAIASALSANPLKKHIITTVVEHPAVYNYCAVMETRGYKVSYLPVDSLGRLNLKDLESAILPDTALVSIMYANNETGVVFPIKEIGQLLKGTGIIFHTDAVQAVGKVPINVKELNLDMLSLSGHKLHAPKGIGALYVRNGLPYHPLLIGGHQENGRRAGTENSASIVGLGTACQLVENLISKEVAYLTQLRNKIENTLLNNLPGSIVNGDTENRLPNTTNISFEYVDGEAILMMLDMQNICVSTGSACSSGSSEPSRILSAMSVPPTAIHGSLRISLSRYNTVSEIDKALDVVIPVVKKLRAMSPF